MNGRCYVIEKRAADQVLRAGIEVQRRREIKISMPGKVVKVLVNEGAKVKEGQAILILEAMKMQNEIKSPQPGKITQIKLKPGESVEAGSLLFYGGISRISLSKNFGDTILHVDRNSEKCYIGIFSGYNCRLKIRE